jgi:hypothetical protein
MASYQASIDSPLPVGRVFDYLVRFDHAVEWDPSVVEGDALDDDVAQGSRFRVVVAFLGRRLDLEYRLVELDRPHRFRVVAEAPSFVSDDVITVEPRGGGSRMTYHAELRPKGWLVVAHPLLRLLFGRIGDRAAEGLRAVLASDPAGDGGH